MMVTISMVTVVKFDSGAGVIQLNFGFKGDSFEDF